MRTGRSGCMGAVVMCAVFSLMCSGTMAQTADVEFRCQLARNLGLHPDALAVSHTLGVIVTAIPIIWFAFAQACNLWPSIEGVRVPDGALTDRLRMLAQTFGVKLAGAAIVRCDRPTYNSSSAVLTGDGWFLVAKSKASEMTSAEIDFIAAHEFVHRAQRHGVAGVTTFLVGFAALACAGVRVLLTPTHLILTDWATWVAPAGLAVLVYDCLYARVQREEEADRLALAHTRDSEAAARAIRSLERAPGATDDDDFIAGPKCLEKSVLLRLRRLRAAADQFGLPLTDALGCGAPDASLLGRARALAASAGLRGIPAYVEIGGDRTIGTAAHFSGGIMLGRRTPESFAPEEIDFLLADRLAAIVEYRRLGMVVALAVVAVAASLLWLGYSSVYWFYPILTIMAVLCLAFLLLRDSVMRQARLPLSITRNLPAAISATVKLHGGDPAAMASGRAIPAKAQSQVQLLRRCARELWIESDEAWQDAEQR